MSSGKQEVVQHPIPHRPHDHSNKLCVLIVSVDCDQEWPHDRCRVGDLALARAFRWLTPHVTVLADATVAEAQSKLRDVVRGGCSLDDDAHYQPRTLVVYYGGHGTREGFVMAPETSSSSRSEVVGSERSETTTTTATTTKKTGYASNRWAHSDFMAILYDGLRPQDRAWLLLDCCYSGNFVERFQQYHDRNNNKNCNCCVVASTAPNKIAGAAWTLTETWLGVMTTT